MSNKKPQRRAQMVGLGFDNEDGHVRITRGSNFHIYLGSEETHERMFETCTKINERLDKQGRSLNDLSRREFLDLVSDVQS